MQRGLFLPTGLQYCRCRESEEEGEIIVKKESSSKNNRVASNDADTIAMYYLPMAYEERNEISEFEL